MSIAEAQGRAGEYVPVDERPEMAVEAFLALVEDSKDRELVRGRLWEREMTYRNRFHSGCESRLATLLTNWCDGQPEPRGAIFSGEAGFRLPGAKPSVVGIDVAYVSAELLAATGPKQKLFHGAPVLAVEILSGSETYEEVAEKVEVYLEAGAIAWVVNPRLRLLTVHRPGAEPVTLSSSQGLDGEPELPGFQVAVGRIFAA